MCFVRSKQIRNKVHAEPSDVAAREPREDVVSCLPGTVSSVVSAVPTLSSIADEAVSNCVSECLHAAELFQAPLGLATRESSAMTSFTIAAVPCTLATMSNDGTRTSKL